MRVGTASESLQGEIGGASPRDVFRTIERRRLPGGLIPIDNCRPRMMLVPGRERPVGHTIDVDDACSPGAPFWPCPDSLQRTFTHPSLSWAEAGAAWL